MLIGLVLWVFAGTVLAFGVSAARHGDQNWPWVFIPLSLVVFLFGLPFVLEGLLQIVRHVGGH